jgi:hypothetical protein
MPGSWELSEDGDGQLRRELRGPLFGAVHRCRADLLLAPFFDRIIP